MEFSYEIIDAQEAEAEQPRERTLTITTDQHGLSLEIEGDQRSIVIDLSGGLLSVYVTNEHGDVQGKARLSLEIGGETAWTDCSHQEE
jgi:hypothetical protein